MSEKDKTEKPKHNSVIKHVPKDAQVIMSILKELNVSDYEPRVINQLLEFTYRYVTCILDDAKVFANHARKKTIDLDDVKLASGLVLEKAFTYPPPRQVLVKLAETRNSMPLPAIRPHCGLRLPPDRYCLTACNYKLRSSIQSKKMTKSALEKSTVKTQIKPANSSTSNSGGGGSVKRQTAVPPITQVVTIPKPVIKFTITTKPTIQDNKMDVDDDNDGDDMRMDTDLETVTNANAVGSIDGAGGNSNSVSSSSVSSGNNLKRDREEDDFEVVQ